MKTTYEPTIETAEVSLSPSRAPVTLLSPSKAHATLLPSMSSDQGAKATESFIPSQTDSSTFQPNVFSKPSFLQECKHSLLSSKFVEDGIVAQNEFTAFLFDRCHAEGLCNDKSEMEFEQLDVSLQLDFILAACEGDNTIGCIDELGQFGIDVEHKNLDIVIDELCSNAFDNAFSMGLVNTLGKANMQTTFILVSFMLSQTFCIDFVPSFLAPTPAVSTGDPSTTGNMITPKKPSSSPTIHRDIDELFPPTEKKALGSSKKALVGISAAFALLLITAGGVVAYRSDYFVKQALNDYNSKEHYHYSATSFNPWTRHSPFPFSIASSCSSSSSFRDGRFVEVFTPNGETILQFDPNTASAVVLGSVYLGDRGGSSSISTGPGRVGRKSTSSYITIGQVTQAKSEVNSASSSGLSSLSSDPSGANQSLYGSSPETGLASESTKNSAVSRTTMPMTQSKATIFERRAVYFDNAVSFADWQAASRVISEYRDPECVTDMAAALKQKKFFFDLYTAPRSDRLSSSDRVSIHPLDIGTSSVGSQFQCVTAPKLSSDESDGPEVLIPWRRGGFSSAFQTSDGKQSEESGSSCRSVFIEHWGSSDLYPPKQPPSHQVKPIFKRAKCLLSNWFKHKKYQNLGHLHEDPSVISMQSFSSNTNLLETPNFSPVFGLPGLLLGTWAAATIPVEATTATVPVEAKRIPTALSDQTNGVERTLNSRSESVLGIKRRDLESGSSEFNSSTGWSSSSTRPSSFISSCGSATCENNIKLMSPSISTLVENESNKPSFADKVVMDVSQTISEANSANEVSVVSNVDIGAYNDREGLVMTQKLTHSCPNYYDHNFFMTLGNELQADAPSVDHFALWADRAHNISDSASCSDSDDTGSRENQHSLSLSLESETDSASQTLDWDITRSKKMSTSSNNSISAEE